MTGEPVTQGQFFERMSMLEEKMQDYHRRGREHVDQQADKILHVIDTQQNSLQGVANRVLMMETQREMEKAAEVRRSLIAGSVSAGVLIGAIESMKRLFGFGR
jgi:hypothetical protein